MAQQIKRLIIDSKNRDFGLNSNDFSIELNPPIEKIKKISLISCSIPNTFYNIEEGSVFIYLQLQQDTTPIFIQFSLESGAYTIDTLIQLLNDRFNGELTFSFNTTKLKIQVVNNTTNEYVLKGTLLKDDIKELLGLTSDITLPVGSQLVAFDSSPYLGGPRYLLLNIDPFNVFCKNTEGTVYGTFIITEDSNSTDIQFYKPLSTYQQIETNGMYNNVSQLQIRLLKPNGKLLDLNGSDWSFVVEFEYYSPECDYR